MSKKLANESNKQIKLNNACDIANQSGEALLTIEKISVIKKIMQKIILDSNIDLKILNCKLVSNWWLTFDSINSNVYALQAILTEGISLESLSELLANLLVSFVGDIIFLTLRSSKSTTDSYLNGNGATVDCDLQNVNIIKFEGD